MGWAAANALEREPQQPRSLTPPVARARPGSRPHAPPEAANAGASGKPPQQGPAHRDGVGLVAGAMRPDFFFSHPPRRSYLPRAGGYGGSSPIPLQLRPNSKRRAAPSHRLGGQPHPLQSALARFHAPEQDRRDLHE